MEYTYTQWHDSLRNKLYEILLAAFPGKMPFIAGCLSVDAMFVWGNALTSDSYDANNNYENLEFDGDSVLKWGFKKYLRTEYPDMPQKVYSELNSEYMSKKHQWVITVGLGLDPYIRTGSEVTSVEARRKIQVDVMESFFGALEKVADMYSNQGTNAVYKMIVYIFSVARIIVIDLETFSRGAPVTQVKQIFERFDRYDVGTPILNVRETGPRQYVASITLTERQLEVLRHFGVNIKSKILVEGSRGSSKKAAESAAYDMALRRLKSYGVTTDWAERMKNESDLEGIDKRYVIPFREKLEDEGYVTFKFDIPRKLSGETMSTMILLGTREDGTKDNIVMTSFNPTEVKYNKVREELVKKYLGF